VSLKGDIVKQRKKERKRKEERKKERREKRKKKEKDPINSLITKNFLILPKIF